jgi:hypothetical protein
MSNVQGAVLQGETLFELAGKRFTDCLAAAQAGKG